MWYSKPKEFGSSLWIAFVLCDRGKCVYLILQKWMLKSNACKKYINTFFYDERIFFTIYLLSICKGALCLCRSFIEAVFRMGSLIFKLRISNILFFMLIFNILYTERKIELWHGQSSTELAGRQHELIFIIPRVILPSICRAIGNYELSELKCM